MNMPYYYIVFLHILQVLFDILLQNSPAFLVKIPINTKFHPKALDFWVKNQ